MSEIFQIDVSEDKVNKLSSIIFNETSGRSFQSQFRKSIGVVVKRVKDSAMTVAAKEVTDYYDIKQSTFKKRTKTRSVMDIIRNDMTAEITFSGGKIPLSEFDTGAPKSVPKRKAKVSRRVYRSSNRTIFDNAFYANINGHFGVFERTTAARTPITEIVSTSGPQMLSNNDAGYSDSVADKVAETMSETFDKRLDHEIERIVNGYGI